MKEAGLRNWGPWEATDHFREKKRDTEELGFGENNLGVDAGCTAGERRVKGDSLEIGPDRSRVEPQARPMAELKGRR